MHAKFLWTALVFYGGGISLTLPSVIRRRASLSAAALVALGAGLALHASSLVLLAMDTGRLPASDVRGALSLFSFLVTTAFFLVYLRYRIASLGIFMLPLAFVLTFIPALEPGRAFDSPAARSGWLIVHIATILLGYVGFFLTFVAGIMYLIQERELKSKNPRAFYYRLPSLEVCDELYFRSLVFGLPLLSVGILTGIVWASRTWKGAWGLDPKILGALITWLIYLVLFSTRLSGSWRGHRAAAGAIFGFVVMMATFLGVSFLSGQHGILPNFGSIP